MIAAVIVSFLPDEEQLLALFKSLSAQVDQIFLIDNSPLPGFSSDECDYAVDILVNQMPTNVGLACAQNIGIEKALSSGADFVILFDQDSDPGDHLVRQLLDAFDESSSAGFNPACVGARPYCVFDEDLVRPALQRPYSTRGSLSLVRQVIASSMLISRRALEDVGLMEAELFIDGVDHEWCWRAASKGYSVAIDERSVMRHRLGDKRGSIFGVKYKVASPVRLYYQFRNILILIRRPYVPLYWKIRNLIAIPFRFIVMSLFEAPRYARLKYMLKGIWHGLAGKKGSIA